MSQILLFFQDQILGMRWLNELIGSILTSIGLNIDEKIGGMLHFFIYDSIKIFILLSVLIYIISYIQLGTVTPFCSCSSIPIFMGFTSAGLPLGVTFSFLISSPMVDLGALILLMSIFGWKVAVLYVIAGLIISVVGGRLIEKLGMDDQVADFIKQTDNVDVGFVSLTVKDRRNFAKEQVIETVKKVSIYIFVGVAIGSVIHNVIPEHWIQSILGDHNFYSVPLATVVGVPMYADIFGTIPVAESLLLKGAGLGTVLSFMMAVTTLSLPSMIMLSKAVKRKLMIVFVAIVTVGIISVGFMFNIFSFLLM